MSAIYLVRHGQASFGAADYDLLSERGERQASVLGNALADAQPRIGLVVSGDMQRHRQTAQACLRAMGREPQWRSDPGWNEFDHVRLIAALRPDCTDPEQLRAELIAQPDPRRAFQALFEQAVARWAGGTHDGDYAETWHAFRTRCRAALQALLDALPKGSDALVFTSGGPIAALAQELLHVPDSDGFRLNWGLVNCGVTKLVRGREGVRLSTLNGHAHFEGEYAGLITYR
ncbi:MAG: histidine phosphatase family protein [Lysobacteraceae bacterium]|nr:MAG: histidine phosphatase family protein [Xanthomonadaceae bacterium]